MDLLALVGAVLACAAVALVSLGNGPQWKPLSRPTAPWCLPDQTPTFSFGFGDLAHDLGPVMGQPLECEHGAPAGDDTLQRTTTGLAVYNWCTNVSMFTRGADHWALLAAGTVHWTDGDPPPEVPAVRTPDLRRPCPPT
jgi:hypothetical protein